MGIESLARAAIVVVALAGCAASTWTKPGATTQDLENDRAVCHAKAEAAVPQNFQMVSVGWDTPPRRECTAGSGNQAPVCINIPGTPGSPRMLDVNATARGKVTEACLKTMGWSR